ncbi:globin-coupled sensor protein [Paenibacillus segetis]|uniref:Methyl-accepting chemotaxis protein n=1 Tax=Paenibacillus segetis TaxID=1325360 RepID=A0ABQ1YVR4_9BACL|nr:globin-coupled sensor protein [Paenibacillus segetis]GGH40178.1 methyl-accepting chemotaxis protein [Paenibacillus segetis]
MKCPFSNLIKSTSQPDLSDQASSAKRGNSSLSNTESKQLKIEGEQEITEQLRMIDLSENDIELLHRMKPLIEKRIDWITNTFYQSVLDVPKLQEIIVKYSSVERLKATLQEHLLDMFSGNIDQEFIAKRLKIAKVHKKVGLEPKWYLSAFQNLQNAFLKVIYDDIQDEHWRLHMIKTTSKLLSLEQQLVLEAYERENLYEKEQQYEIVKNELKGKITIFSEGLEELSLDTNAAVEELVASSHEVSEAIKRSVYTAEESQRLAEAGRNHLHELNERIGSINVRTSMMNESVSQLDASSEKIQNIVDTVSGIASQIKLLSLNATIEAAHVGEQGKGFAVVAHEVSKLSEHTKDTVTQIEGLIKQSVAITTQVVQAIEEVRKLAQNGKVQSEATNEVFLHILSTMQSSADEIIVVEEQISELIDTIKGIGSSTSEVAASAERLNKVSSEL